MLKKIKSTLIAELSKGLSPIKITQSLVVGLLIGCFPLLGFSSLLAVCAGRIFSLNHIVLQAANYLMYPVQLLLFPIYIKIITEIFSLKNIPIRPDIIIKLFFTDPKDFLHKFSFIAAAEVILWLGVSLISYFILLKILAPIITKIKEDKNE